MRIATALVLTLLSATVSLAQVNKRDTQVKQDRKTFENSKQWIYNDLNAGIKQAEKSGKPMLVVFRCVPCEACHDFDEDVAGRDPIVSDLMDQFECVRIVYGNSLDLKRFQYDFDLSFAAILMNPDGTIYGRFGTRSARPEERDISLEGLRKALGAALAMHKDYKTYKPLLAGKQVTPDKYDTPRDYPSLKGKYKANLDYEGQVTRSCIHCHQIREADRAVHRSTAGTLPDKVLFPYPDPSVLGLSMNPKEKATVSEVAKGSIAAGAGLKPGDEIVALGGQPLLSIADLQWVLHETGTEADLKADIRRDGEAKSVVLNLKPGWRKGDLSWRPTSWDLRRQAFGGMRLDPLPDAEREKLGLPKDSLALFVKHVGQYGEHALAKNAGVVAGDILIGFGDAEDARTETDLFAHALQKKKPGDEVELTVLRKGEKKRMKIKLR